MSKVGETRYQVPGTAVLSSSKMKPKNRVLLYTEYIRRCLLVLSASSAASAFLLLVLVLLLLLLLASAAAASAAAAAAAATALRTAGWSCSVFFCCLPTLLRKLHGDGCCCTEPSENFRVQPRYDYEKKHVSRDSNMCCCCCCRFCGGAPTTDEKIHAPVLHDASQIDYCRY